MDLHSSTTTPAGTISTPRLWSLDLNLKSALEAQSAQDWFQDTTLRTILKVWQKSWLEVWKPTQPFFQWSSESQVHLKSLKRQKDSTRPVSLQLGWVEIKQDLRSCFLVYWLIDAFWPPCLPVFLFSSATVQLNLAYNSLRWNRRSTWLHSGRRSLFLRGEHLRRNSFSLHFLLQIFDFFWLSFRPDLFPVFWHWTGLHFSLLGF